MYDDEAPTCQTCIHWVPWTLIDSDEIRPEDMPGGVMPSPPHGDERAKVENPQVWGTCGLIVHPKGGDRSRGLPAFTMDSSDYWGRLSCREDFGCILHDSIPVDPPVPEFPGTVIPEEAQPHVAPRPQIQGDSEEETVDLMTAASPDPITSRKIRPAPRLKDVAANPSRPRLPDGLGQAHVQEES